MHIAMSECGPTNSLPQLPVGRGSRLNPPNRFERIHLEADFDQTDPDDPAHQARRVATSYFDDNSQSVVSENNSPDVPFRFSINPYRGCSHGCSYCYARPYHEYLGFSAGLDFETKILVKRDAPGLFRKWLSRPAYRCEPVNLSGVTDPYQPAEREFEITRGCLHVALQCHQPVFLITKNAMVTRDLDLLRELASHNLVRVAISVTSLDQSLTRIMEPRTSSPAARLAAIGELSNNGVPTVVMVAPIIPGLTDSEVPEILRAVADAGAVAANYTIVRLNGAVEPVFEDWLDRHFPLRKIKVLERVAALHGGQLSDSRFGARMRGRGVLAEVIRATFKTFAKKHGLDRPVEPLETSLFRRPERDARQGRLFPVPEEI